MNENYKVYMHRFPNGKIYIGITCQNPEERWRGGAGYKAQLVHRAIEKYGWDAIQHVILFDGLCKEEAEQKEIELIKLFSSNNPEFGYNVENGGNCIGTHSEITKRKIAESNRRRIVTDETRRKQSAAHSGFKMSDEQKEKIRAAMLGRVISEETREKMSAASRGRVVSEQTRKKLSEAKSGKPISFKSPKVRGDKISKAMKERDKSRPDIRAKMISESVKKCSKSVLQKKRRRSCSCHLAVCRCNRKSVRHKSCSNIEGLQDSHAMSRVLLGILMISEKQKKILAFPYSKYDAIICDGAVRSGKTSIMSVAFVNWAMDNYSRQRFGFCGKTVDSCWKNLVLPLTAMSYIRNKYTVRVKRSEKIIEISRGGVINYFEIFGGKDEGSAALIQGRTLAGVLLDEVALMPESFFNQALARCSVDGAKLWFSCNPDNPMHWFYTKWIQRHKERNALYLHFAMRDNPSLSQKTLERYESMYSGVFYDRYIKGLWVAAEGLIYGPQDANIVDAVPKRGEYYISCDYGTLNPFSAGLWCWDGKIATRIREYYYSGRDECSNKTDEEYYTELENLAEDLHIKSVIVDPSAASFIEVIRRHKRFTVKKAVNDVLPGIMTTARYLQDGTIKIHRSCKDAIREFGLYRWDEESTEDRPIKENDHAMDDIRYFVMTILRHKVGKEQYIPLYARR